MGIEATTGFDAVLAAARAGRSWGFKHLFELVAEPLLGYFRGQGAWDPDGSTNDVLVRAFTDIDRFFGDQTGFRAWVFTIARCRMIDERRASARRPVCEPLLGNVVALFGGDVEAEAGAALGRDWVEETLGALEADQREVLALRILSDLTIAEIADVMGKTPGAVKALQRRGLAAIRRHLALSESDFLSVAVPL